VNKTKYIALAILMMTTVIVPGFTAEAELQEVALGALLSLTGDLASAGESSQAALELALRDINEYLAEIVSPMRVKLIIEDTGADPAIALEKLRKLAAAGAAIVIGPQSSAEVAAVKEYADDNDILLVSQQSTAPSLAIAGDNVFRFALNDTLQAEAVADRIWKDGIRAVIPMQRGDVWGDDLAAAIKHSFEQRGGIILEGLRYSPSADDFSSEL